MEPAVKPKEESSVPLNKEEPKESATKDEAVEPSHKTEPVPKLNLRLTVMRSPKKIGILLPFSGNSFEELQEAGILLAKNKKLMGDDDVPISWSVMSDGANDWQEGIMLDETSYSTFCTKNCTRIMLEL